MKKDEISEGLAASSPASSRQITQNDARTCGKGDAELTQPRSGPVRYELINRLGGSVHRPFATATLAAEFAKELWPDQSQDPDRTGKGWDVQVVS